MHLLVSGPDFHRYTDSVARAFDALGCSVTTSNWPDLSENILQRARTYALKKYEHVVVNHDHYYENTKAQHAKYRNNREQISRYNQELVRLVDEANPDAVLVLKGEIIHPETAAKLSDRATTVLWCYDKATRYPNVVEGAHHYDLFYTFEPSDADQLGGNGVEARYLPMAYDPYYYQKLEGADEPIDVCFVGRMYPHRRRLLHEIVRHNPDLRVEVWGKAWSWYNPFTQYEYKVRRPQLGDAINNHDVHHTDINKIYNASKVCLNIHSHQSRQGVNPRTFEIPGSGALELVDRKGKLTEAFEVGDELACYTDIDDAAEKIRYYVDNPAERRRVAERGHQKASHNHTFRHRAQHILDDIG